MFTELRKRGIPTRSPWQPMHRPPAHAGSPATDCTVVDRLNAQAMNIPSPVGLTTAQQHEVVAALQEVHRTAAVAASRSTRAQL